MASSGSTPALNSPVVRRVIDLTMTVTAPVAAPAPLVVPAAPVPSGPVGAGPHDFLDGRIVTLIVGEGDLERRWNVHETLLSARSSFFKDEFNRDEEAREMNELYFRDVRPKLFSMLLQWIYGTTFGPSAGARVFRYPAPDGETTVSDYIHLYALAHRLEIIGVKNAAIDAVYNYFGDENAPEARAPSIHDVNFIFDEKNTSPDSPMRRLLIAHLLFHLFNKKREDIGSLPEGWADVMCGKATVSYHLLEMLSEWGWVMGGNVPPMRIKNRQSFHDPIHIDDDEVVKPEPME